MLSPVFTTSLTAFPAFDTSSKVSAMELNQEGSRASMAARKDWGAGMGAALTMEASAGAERQRAATRAEVWVEKRILNMVAESKKLQNVSD